MTELRKQETNRWQDWVNLVLAAWLFISPWVLKFAPGFASASVAVAWNAWIFAIVIGVFSVAGLVRAQVWEEVVVLLSAIWVFISPWILHYTGMQEALWSSVIVGALIFISAVWDLNTMPATAKWRA